MTKNVSFCKGARTLSCQSILVPHAEFAAGRELWPAGAAMDAYHHHPGYELCCRLSGTVLYRTQAQEFTAGAGSFVLLGPQCPHWLSAPARQPGHGITLHFTADFLRPLAGALPCPVPELLPAGEAVASLDAARQCEAEALLDALLRAAACTDVRAPARCRLLLGALLLLLRPAWGSPVAAGAAGRLAAQAEAYLSTHYADPVTLPGLAAQFGVSPSYLSRAFRQATGQTIVARLNALRVMAARQALRAGMAPASAARACGFGGAAHFRRVFKAQVGVSPQQYRRRAQAKAPAEAGAESTGR